MTFMLKNRLLYQINFKIELNRGNKQIWVHKIIKYHLDA